MRALPAKDIAPYCRGVRLDILLAKPGIGRGHCPPDGFYYN